MSSQRGNENPSKAKAVMYNPALKGKSTSTISTFGIDQLNMNSDQGSNSSKQFIAPNSSSKARGRGSRHTPIRPTGRGYYTKSETSYQNSDTKHVPAASNNGRSWSAIVASSLPSQDTLVLKENTQRVDDESDESDESDFIEDSDDELMSDDDDDDSDESQKSHESRKKNKSLREFFESLDGWSIEQINGPEKLHCPACKGSGPGAIKWYIGLQPLITHAKTQKTKKVKLHRELAQLLEEELRRRGTSAIPSGEKFGMWKGLDDSYDREIVWPPMVMIMNTKLKIGDDDKWIGMGNQELLEYFGSYTVEKARHSYGPQGHRGKSLLIFEDSVVGYIDAVCLSNEFENKCRDRVAWDMNGVRFSPGGERKLYGFMAEKHDMDDFNKHSQDKPLKYQMKSYQEMVVTQLKKMGESNQHLLWYMNNFAKEQKSRKALEQSFAVLSKELQKSKEEIKILKMRTKEHHNQNKESMDSQEQFFIDTFRPIYDGINAKEQNFEKIQMDELKKVTISERNVSSAKEGLSRANKLKKAYEEKMAVLKQRHLEEEMALKEEYDAELNLLRAQ